jgi:P-type Ca2+ transporter type 2C
MLFFGSLAAFGLHVGAMNLPLLQNVLSAQPVSIPVWGIAIGVSLLVLPAIEFHKWYMAHRAPTIAPPPTTA